MTDIPEAASDGIADFLRCLSVLEEKTSLLFENITKKTGITSVKSKLLKISRENKKHAAILKEISQRVGNPKAELKECKRKLSLVFKTIEEAQKEISKKENLSAKELTSLICILDSSESEEQFMLIQAKTFQFMSKEMNRLYGVNFATYRKLLASIARDEENHRRILDQITETLKEH